MTYKIAVGIILVLIFVCLIILFCALFIKLYIKKVKEYTRVIYQKDIDFQKSLTSAIVETQEQVLNTISQDLHDDAGQQLTYINFQLENLKYDSDELDRKLQPISDSVANLAATIRKISHSLNNQLLLQENFVNAIAAEINRMQNDLVKINFEAPESCNKDFSGDEKIVIYRIFQEIINNALKHSNSTEINIRLATDPYFKLTVTDNGDGFDTNVKNNTLGLQSMMSRAAAINYQFAIVSEKGKGTQVSLTENIS